MNKPKKLTLDYSKWICGEGGPHQLGEGKVALKNDQGFMCCLGMWSLQCGASENELLNKGEPNELDTLIPIFAEDVKYEDSETCFISVGKTTTNLSSDCMCINDDKDTTPEQKILELKERLGREGIALEVINKP